MYCVVLLLRKEAGYLGNQGVDGRITLTYIFKKWDCRVWTGFMWLAL